MHTQTMQKYKPPSSNRLTLSMFNIKSGICSWMLNVKVENPMLFLVHSQFQAHLWVWTKEKEFHRHFWTKATLNSVIMACVGTLCKTSVGNTIQFLQRRQLESSASKQKRLSRQLLSDRMASAPGYLHSCSLVGHYGCVNAVEFSNKGGELLVSGKLFCLYLLTNIQLHKFIHHHTFEEM